MHVVLTKLCFDVGHLLVAAESLSSSFMSQTRFGLEQQAVAFSLLVVLLDIHTKIHGR